MNRIHIVENLEARRLLAAQLVVDLQSGTDGSLPSPIAVAGSNAYFFASDGSSYVLAKSDGTAGGSQVVHHFGPDEYYSSGGAVGIGNLLVFTEHDDAHGDELWVTDGTDVGTKLLKDIVPGADGSTPQFLSVANGFVYFSPVSTADSEIWRTDGTERNDGFALCFREKPFPVLQNFEA